MALAVRKAHHDELGQQSAALAFITLVSLVPLLSALSFVGARAFAEQDLQQSMLELISRLLPFSEEKILETLTSYLDNANTIAGFGFVIFIVTAITAFSSIEQTINHIWNVPRQRSFRERLLSISLLLFWGPMLIGTTYSGLFFLRQFDLFERFSSTLPGRILPFMVTFLGLTMLYWLVPYTKVHFRSALGGGFLATLLLEGLRQGFGLYQSHATSVGVIYSGLALVFFFVISIQFSWWLVLLGSEITFCIQNHAVLLRERRHPATPEGSWLGLVALTVLADRLRDGVPITPHEMLADRLQLPAPDLLGALEPLVAGGLIRETGGDDEGFLLSCDPYQLRLVEIFELYERNHWEILVPLPPEIVTQLEKLRVGLTDARDQHAGSSVLADLLQADLLQADLLQADSDAGLAFEETSGYNRSSVPLGQ